jgi:hypothetical protein
MVVVLAVGYARPLLKKTLVVYVVRYEK